MLSNGLGFGGNFSITNFLHAIYRLRIVPELILFFSVKAFKFIHVSFTAIVWDRVVVGGRPMVYVAQASSPGTAAAVAGQSVFSIRKESVFTAPTIRKEFPESWIWEEVNKYGSGLLTSVWLFVCPVSLLFRSIPVHLTAG